MKPQHFVRDAERDEQAGIAGAIEYLEEDSARAGNVSVLAMVAGAAWVTTAIAAAVALHKAGAGRGVVVAMCISTVFAAHTVPAAIGLFGLFVAIGLRERQRASAGVAALAETPRGTSGAGNPQAGTSPASAQS